MSKKNQRKQEKITSKLQKKQAKKSRQTNNPAKWEAKKTKKKAVQQRIWESKYPFSSPNCPLPFSIFPSPKNCKDCKLLCEYNPNNLYL